MSNYKLDKNFLNSNGEDTVNLGRNTVVVGSSSKLSQKVLGKLYDLGKDYVIKDGEEVVEQPKAMPKVKKVKKSKKKKIILDEPEESPTEEKEESDLSEEGES